MRRGGPVRELIAGHHPNPDCAELHECEWKFISNYNNEELQKSEAPLLEADD